MAIGKAILGLLLLSCTAQAQYKDRFNIIAAIAEDISPLATVFESTSLPVDEDGNFIARQMASVGNGHVATTIYTDTVYMNGLYNGERGESHRARIPSGNNIRVNITSQSQTFALDVGRGVFTERSVLAGGAVVEQRTFAHRIYTRLIVTQIQVTAGSGGPLTLQITNSPGGASADLNTPVTGDFGTLLGATYTCADILEREDSRYQEFPLQACSVSTAVPTSLTFQPDTTTTHTYISGYGFGLEEIGADFNAVATLIVAGQHDEVLSTHVQAWEEVWNNGAILVEGNNQLGKVVYGSLYYILSSLPVTTSQPNTPNNQFYGLSPGGLAYGSLLMDYQGHSFWDTETWMYPAILYLYPEAAREILNYRMAVTQAARDHAIATNYSGARFPWESGRTGREVTPDCCPETRDLQVHISSDISFAIRQYIAMTRDLNWLTETQENYVTNGCGLLRDIAEFWTTRATFNATTGYHDIKCVMPPDEDNHCVDNNPYTNIGAGYAIFYAKYGECLCSGSSTPVPEEWLEIAKSLKLLYDEESDYHPEFEGYEFGTPIKQADVVLVGFPQLYDMADSTRRNDMLIYENVTREDGPAMTWAMHTIGFLELDELEQAAQLFERSHQWYMREPFKVWTEAKPPTIGAINFITGMGGFLQSVFSGYGGFRVYPEKITFTKPRVLPASTGLVFRGVKYLNNVLDINITQTDITLTLREAFPSNPLQIASNDGQPIDFVGSLTFSTQVANLHLEITTKTPTDCPLPLDKIGVPLPTVADALEEQERANWKKYGWTFSKERTALEGVFEECVTPGHFALTFDDGPTVNGNTALVLDVLAEKNVTATFFVTGYGWDGLDLISEPRKHALLRRIRDEGHQLASHTYLHEALTANRTREHIVADCNQIVTALRDIVGVTPTALRPPYGDVNDTVVQVITEEFGYAVVNWNIDTNDWDHKEDIDTSFEFYLKAMANASNVTDSFIALHHDPASSRGGELAARAIDLVRSKGFTFVTVDECVGNSVK